jgi:hypothetical protein
MERKDVQQQQAEPEKEQDRASMAEFGICYDTAGCPAGSEIAFSVTKDACRAAGGKSWKGGASGCVTL